VVYTSGDAVFVGGILLHTVCQRADGVHLPAKTELDCFDPHRAPGFGTLRVDAPTLAQARDGTDRIVGALEADLPATEFHAATTDVGRPTWASTAPVSLGTGAL